MVKKSVCCLFGLVFILMLFGGCKANTQVNAIDSSVLAAWEGIYTKENRAEAISVYEKRYIPVYISNIDGGTVSFTIDFEGIACGTVMLAPADDGKNAEADTVVDFTTFAELDGYTVSVDISWWQSADVSTQSFHLWSYLLWVKDAEGVNHYYYFRVDHTA